MIPARELPCLHGHCGDSDLQRGPWEKAKLGSLKISTELMKLQPVTRVEVAPRGCRLDSQGPQTCCLKRASSAGLQTLKRTHVVLYSGITVFQNQNRALIQLSLPSRKAGERGRRPGPLPLAPGARLLPTFSAPTRSPHSPRAFLCLGYLLQ